MQCCANVAADTADAADAADVNTLSHTSCESLYRKFFNFLQTSKGIGI